MLTKLPSRKGLALRLTSSVVIFAIIAGDRPEKVASTVRARRGWRWLGRIRRLD